MASLQDTQKRADDAIQHKLNAVADGLNDLAPDQLLQNPDLRTDAGELRATVGLETRESGADFFPAAEIAVTASDLFLRQRPARMTCRPGRQRSFRREGGMIVGAGLVLSAITIWLG